MAYFAVIPNPVMASKKISDSEKVLYARLSSKLNEEGYCDLPDSKLAEIMNVDERTVYRRLKNLEDNDFITRIYNRKTSKRRIYLKGYTPQFLDEKLPEKNLEDIMKFKEAFPERRIDMSILPSYVDMDLMIRKIKAKKFLREATNMNLSSCVRAYYQIISKNGYEDADKIKRKIHGHDEYDDWTPEQFNALYNNIDDLEFEKGETKDEEGFF